MRDFRKILAWQTADGLAVRVYKGTAQHFPRHEQCGLISQMRRAAVSVPANIAEGSGKQYLTEFCQYLYTPRASLTELEYYIRRSRRVGYLANPPAQELEHAHVETARIL
jgi:four helix bundle protein